MVKARRKRGRTRDPDAKRNHTTRQGRGIIPAKCGCCGLPTSLIVRKRLALAGDRAVSTDFPLDNLVAIGFLTEEERDIGMRFAAFAWWLFGVPFAGTEMLYERVVSGVTDADLSPPRIGAGDPEAERREAERMASNRRRFERMERALRAAAPRDIVLTALKRAAQFLDKPGILLREGLDQVTGADLYEVARIKKALGILLAQQKAEDRHVRRARAARMEERGVQP